MMTKGISSLLLSGHEHLCHRDEENRNDPVPEDGSSEKKESIVVAFHGRENELLIGVLKLLLEDLSDLWRSIGSKLTFKMLTPPIEPPR